MEQIPHELYEDARKRVKQKKLLFFHFVVFILGSLLLYVSSEFLLQNPDPTAFKWYPWVIVIWAFFFALHAVNVLIVDSFMNKKWERAQIDKLIEKQQRKIEELQKKVEQDYKVEIAPSKVIPNLSEKGTDSLNEDL